MTVERLGVGCRGGFAPRIWWNALNVDKETCGLLWLDATISV